MKPSRKIVEFANNSTSQDAMQIDCADDSLAAVLSTPWIHNGTGPAKDAVTYPGTVPMAKARAKARTTSARAHTNGARATKMGKANIPSSYGTRRVTASLEGQDPVMARATLAVEITSHEIAPQLEEK